MTASTDTTVDEPELSLEIQKRIAGAFEEGWEQGMSAGEKSSLKVAAAFIEKKSGELFVAGKDSDAETFRQLAKDVRGLIE